jgi:hypothetical protein
MNLKMTDCNNKPVKIGDQIVMVIQSPLAGKNGSVLRFRSRSGNKEAQIGGKIDNGFSWYSWCKPNEFAVIQLAHAQDA